MSVTISGTTGISAIPDDIVTETKILDSAVTPTKLDPTVLADYQRVQLEADQTAAGSYIDFLNIPAWAKRITLMFQDISMTGTTVPLIQLGDSGGIVASSYDSVSTRMTTASTYNFVDISTSGFILASALDANSITGMFTLCNLSGNVWIGSGMFKSNATTSIIVNGAANGLTGTLDTVRITREGGSGTFDAGVFSLLVEG